eukprot:766132-Hanusia_phi.AAC.1
MAISDARQTISGNADDAKLSSHLKEMEKENDQEREKMKAADKSRELLVQEKMNQLFKLQISNDKHDDEVRAGDGSSGVSSSSPVHPKEKIQSHVEADQKKHEKQVLKRMMEASKEMRASLNRSVECHRSIAEEGEERRGEDGNGEGGEGNGRRRSLMVCD